MSAPYIVYKLVPRGDGLKLDKVPLSPDTLLPANAHDPATWLDESTATFLAESLGPGHGVGIVIRPDSGLFAIDLDGCAENGEWKPYVAPILSQFPGAYVEVSVSGSGLHVIGSYTGPRPLHGTRCAELRAELYTGSRFIALGRQGVSGDWNTDHTAALHALIAEHFPPRNGESGRDDAWTTEPVPGYGIEDDAELIATAKRPVPARAIFNDGITFAKLWAGDADALAKAYPPQTAGQNHDGSAADLALCNLLAFYSGGNCEQILKLWRQSGLYRPKTDRDDYARNTVLRACAGRTDWYQSREQKAAARAEKFVAGPVTAGDTREVVKLSEHDFDVNAQRAEAVLADANAIFVHGGRLVRIGRAPDISDTNERAEDQAVCVEATPAWIRRELMTRLQYWKFDKRSNDWTPTSCPKDIPDSIAQQKSWPTINRLLAISSVPILRPDMSVVTEPGYDVAAGVYYTPTMTFPPIPPEPTVDDARAALERLFAPFNEFPYATEESKATFLAHVLTTVLRSGFDTSPVFVYSAPIAATGKTKLAAMASLIAAGTTPAQSPFSESEELRKVLFATLLAGDTSLLLDNVPTGIKVRAPFLCAFATSSVYSDRVLGVSETRKAPNRCTVSLTGNNITPAGDLARRSLACRLDANAETARGRTFRIPDLKAHVLQNRGQLVVDVLTIVRAYALAGRPFVAKPMESFEQWSRLVRDPLVWLGMADPVAGQADETDDETGLLVDAFAALEPLLAEPRTAAELVPMITVAKHADVRGALQAAGCDEPSDATRLGYWLRDHRDKVSDGRKLVRLKKGKLGVRWQIQTRVTMG